MKFHFMQGRSSSTWHVLSGRGVEKNTGIVSAVIRELGIANCQLQKGEGETQCRRETRLVELVKA
jgi:hypothetical protein